VAQRVKAFCLLGERQARAGKHEPVLLPAAFLVDGQTLPSRLADRNIAMVNVGLADESGDQVASVTARGKHSGYAPAEHARDAGDINATTAGIETDTATANLVGRPNLVGTRRDVKRGVHGERRDRCSVLWLLAW
jgi:hypothetical protein